jgi:hypothetical protein
MIGLSLGGFAGNLDIRTPLIFIAIFSFVLWAKRNEPASPQLI